MLSHPDVVRPVKTTSRPRQIFQTLPGKCVAILRDLETDLFDFMANLCIHIVESRKIVKKIRSPVLFRDLLMARDDQDKVVSILTKATETKEADLTTEEVEGLQRIWPRNLGENLANILMHHNDFSLTISEPACHLRQDAIEAWAKKLWLATAKLFNFPSDITCESIPDDDLTVDIIQGSRRAFTNLI